MLDSNEKIAKFIVSIKTDVKASYIEQLLLKLTTLDKHYPNSFNSSSTSSSSSSSSSSSESYSSTSYFSSSSSELFSSSSSSSASSSSSYASNSSSSCYTSSSGTIKKHVLLKTGLFSKENRTLGYYKISRKDNYKVLKKVMTGIN